MVKFGILRDEISLEGVRMEFSEGMKALVEPATKLIDAVSSAIGTVYEPRKIRRLADARAYEIDTIAEAVRSNMDIPIVYNPENGGILDAANFQELAQRTGQRFLFQEITKQQNIEAVVSKARDELEGMENVTAEPVNRDWLFRFFNSIEDISDEQIQTYWAKILAGEVGKPGSFSLRTLQTLSTLSKQEAETLENIAQFSFCANDENYIFNDSELYKEYDIGRKVFILIDCGLLSESNLLVRTGMVEGRGEFISVKNLICVCNNDSPQKFQFPMQRFTPVGNELLKIISFVQNEEFAIKCFKKLKQRLPELKLTAHTIKWEMDGLVEFEEDDILTK